MSDRGLEFEHWIRFTLPVKLNLSDSKRVAMDKTFYGFADYVRPLEKSATREFETFITEFKKRAEKIRKWKAPKGTYVSPVYLGSGKFDEDSEGNLRVTLYRKKKT